MSNPEYEGLDFEEPIMELEKRIAELESFSSRAEVDLSEEISKLRERADATKEEIFSNLTPWQRVQVARVAGRPVTSDYISLLFENFIELHGDRNFRDDKAIITGLGTLDGRKCMIIGHRRGKTTKERMECFFGSAHPEGYRKALAKMKMAEKFGFPVITFINTPGAYPGIGAEERGQSSAIAVNIMEMARLKVPVICIVIGEGGSGGALGIGIGDRVAILENAFFSVISPEGCAAILWRDGARAPEAAEVLGLDPPRLQTFGIIDEIIPEPLGGAHRNPTEMMAIMRESLIRYLDEISAMSTEEMLEARYRKYRKIGEYVDAEEQKIAAKSKKSTVSGA
jgi:acetyl-CoA carboxylase carboxyl transferase subunit alpha